MRVARETYVLLARFRDDTVKKRKGGACWLPLLLSSLLFFESMLCRTFGMMVVTPATAVLTMMAIMRGRRVGRLRLRGTGTILRSRLQG